MKHRTMTAEARDSRLIDTDELRIYLNIGRNNAMKFGEEIGAKVRIGRRVLWDKQVIDKYISSIAGAK